MIKLLGRQTSGNVQKVIFMLEEISVPYVREDYGRQFYNTQTPEYLALNPNGKVPTLVDGDTVIWELNTILRYLAAKHAPKLTGATPAEVQRGRALDGLAARQREHRLCHGVQGSREAGRGARARLMRRRRKELAAALAIADGHLQGKDWFALGRMTIADIALAPILKRCLGFPIERPALPALERWMASDRLAPRLPGRRRARSLPRPPPERGGCEPWRTMGTCDDAPGRHHRAWHDGSRHGGAVRARRHRRARASTSRPRRSSARAQQVPLAEGVLDRLGIAAPEGGAGAITFHDDLAEAVAGADLVIENVPEKIEIKAEVYRALDALAAGRHHRRLRHVRASRSPSCRPSCRIPARVVGMHWSNPPHIIPMIEVIAGEKTAPATVDFIVRTIRELNLLPVVVKKDVPGFVENRVLYALLREAVALVEAGVIDPEDLDTCVSWGIGYKLGVVGPMALLDMAGLDIYESVASFLNAELSTRERRGALRRASAPARAGSASRPARASTATRPTQIAALQAERAAPLRRRAQGAGGAGA